MQHGPPCQELPKLLWGAQAAQSFGELGSHGNTEHRMNLPAGAVPGYFYFIHSGDRFYELPLDSSGWRTPGLLGCLGRVDVCHELQQSQDIAPALLHSSGAPVWFYFSLPEVVPAVKSFQAWVSRAPFSIVSPCPFTLTVQALLSQFYSQ